MFQTVILGYCDTAFSGCRAVYSFSQGRKWEEFDSKKLRCRKLRPLCYLDAEEDSSPDCVVPLSYCSLPDKQITLIMLTNSLENDSRFIERLQVLVKLMAKSGVKKTVVLSSSPSLHFCFPAGAGICKMTDCRGPVDHDSTVKLLSALFLVYSVPFDVYVSLGFRARQHDLSDADGSLDAVRRLQDAVAASFDIAFDCLHGGKLRVITSTNAEVSSMYG